MEQVQNGRLAESAEFQSPGSPALLPAFASSDDANPAGRMQDGGGPRSAPERGPNLNELDPCGIVVK